MFILNLIIYITIRNMYIIYYFSGGADDFDEVEDDADLDDLDQPEVIYVLFFSVN